MADTVTTKVIWSSNTYALIKWTNVSDSTGESNVTKLDLDGSNGGVYFYTSNGAAPKRVSIMELKWDIQGMSYVKLAWNHTADDIVHIMTGIDKVSYYSIGGFVDPNTSGDTVGGAGIGDLLITTSGQVNGGTYDITALVKFHDT